MSHRGRGLRQVEVGYQLESNSYSDSNKFREITLMFVFSAAACKFSSALLFDKITQWKIKLGTLLLYR